MIINDGLPKMTNKEVCDKTYEALIALREGKGAKSQKEKEQMEKDYYRIVNGSQDGQLIMDWLKQIYDEKDPMRAQQLIANSLIPIK